MKSSASQKLAARYVDALFDVAQKASALAAVEKDLLALARLADTEKSFAAFLANPLLTREQSAQAAEAVLAKMGAHEVTKKFMAMLARQKRLPALPVIAALFAQAVAAARGELSADVVSAKELGANEIAAIEDRLAKACGRKVTVKTQVDPELLGGLVVRIGSQQLDSSVAGKLQRLKNMLKAA